MHWRKLASVMLIFMSILPGGLAAAQGDPLNPHGSIPWPVPPFPVLASPTPYRSRPTPTPQPYTVTPSPTPTGTATPTSTPAPAVTEQSELATLVGQNQVIQATLDAMTGQTVGDYGMATAAAQIGGYARYFFGYAKGLELNHIRGAGIVVTFVLVAVVFVVLVRLITLAVPVMGTMARWMLDILRLVAELLPF